MVNLVQMGKKKKDTSRKQLHHSTQKFQQNKQLRKAEWKKFDEKNECETKQLNNTTNPITKD